MQRWLSGLVSLQSSWPCGLLRLLWSILTVRWDPAPVPSSLGYARDPEPAEKVATPGFSTSLPLRLPCAAAVHFSGHYTELRGQSGASRHAAAVAGANEGTRLVERQLRHISTERIPHALQSKVLLDVGEVEGGDRGFTLFQVSAHGSNRL